MGSYAGAYQSISRVWANQRLTTRFIDETLGTNDIATAEQDTILPTVWRDWVNVSTFGCEFRINRPRLARLFTQSDRYLLVPIPWNESDANFNEFFITVRDDPRIFQVRYIGQIINYGGILWHVRQFQGV